MAENVAEPLSKGTCVIAPDAEEMGVSLRYNSTTINPRVGTNRVNLEAEIPETALWKVPSGTKA
ncbi:hypothetical protein [Arthrobacter mobilis]|uniref:Uncharacterized protein n=1 Tax=Arthrobacter mobilis TaxID=2724944 RepID=A0A7X6HHN6_9MICC|nr:hypothetical protein [Arthrobacter mobilis]NKX55922.1 hypothetical protein [Arthrobacter mobilis]